MNLKSSYFFLPTLVIASAVSVLASAQTQVFSGYGYIIDCSVDAPDNLTATTDSSTQSITFSWDAAEFNDCDATAADHYRLQIRYNDGTLIREYNNINATEKTVALRTLQRNRSYKFHVRAVASDDTETEWSDYKLFRSTPRKPTHVSITALSGHAVRATWQNIARSQNLRYYQIVVRRANNVVYRKNVRIGLRKARTGIIIRRLRPATEYTLKVRAVATSSVSGRFTVTTFTTPAE